MWRSNWLQLAHKKRCYELCSHIKDALLLLINPHLLLQHIFFCDVEGFKVLESFSDVDGNFPENVSLVCFVSGLSS